ncbi:MAG: enoyl-CoA hydratase [Betaproteobacteria bacterium RIFCSPLOWO2_02_67_12]|nr:MAG: enoyl-CoA hydratase [Betaproteobacteria bacterium RIFCSPLOWO2_02_67_12]OGA26882.1 MAG: enoyl-CoA hydratase [Betaproteobacteria bacterium RIFCSPLOWO2_02_FULL_68_150]OGA55283.1 MAG: enoyl-CoA hydratase [Betaproteobacteria bacterium RIFCSPLOWO2_12_FULL_67_28]
MSAVPQAESPILLREDRDGVCTLTLNRPDQFNALSGELLDRLQATLEAIATDTSVRVVVIAARGRGFCAGHDLKEIRALGTQERIEGLFRKCSKVMISIVSLPQPVIARVHAAATAAGCQLVAQCDLAVAAEGAKFAVSGVNFGLFCSTPAVALARNIGRKQAMEMLLTGEFIDAQTARSYGLVNRVVPPAQLDAEVDRLAATVAAKPRGAVASGKRAFYRQLEMGLESAYALAGDVISCNAASDEGREGMDAFIEKRKPDWPAA